MYIKFGDPKQWRSKMDLHSGDPWISNQGIRGSPIRGSKDLLKGDPNKKNLFRVLFIWIFIKVFHGSPCRGSLDLLKGDPNKQILLWVLFILISIHRIYGSPFMGSMDLHSEDPWIFLKEIQINRYQIVDMFIHILTFRVLFIWISIQGIHGSKG